MFCSYFLLLSGMPFHSWVIYQFLFWLSAVFFFLLLLVCLMSYPRKHYQIQCHKTFALWFFSKVFFIVLGFTVRCLIHFELIIEYYEGKSLTWLFYMWISSFLSLTIEKSAPFLFEWSWNPCWKSFDSQRVCFWDLHFVLLIS